MKVNLIALDDHFMQLEHLKDVFSQHKQLNLIESFTQIKDLQYQLPKLIDKVDVFLLDIYLADGNGLELAIYLKTHHPDKKVLLLSGIQNQFYVTKAKLAGIDGYVYKTIKTEMLLDYLLRIINHETIYMELPMRMDNTGKDKDFINNLNALRDDDIELIKDIAAGLSYQEIADKQFKSYRTIEGKVRALVSFFGAKNKTEMSNNAMKYLQ